MLELNKIYCMDNVLGMSQLDDASVDLTVTSPPYDNLRDYKNHTWDFEGVVKQLFRVTKNNGIVVWVVGDQTKDFKESLSSFKQAMYFTEIGFGLLDTMIYHKPTIPPPYPTMMRYAQSFEYMFVFSKGKPKTFNPIKIEKTYAAHAGGTFRQKDGSLKPQNTLAKDNLKQITNMWSIPSGGKDLGHPAPFPERLAEQHILTWSNEGDIVLDPFIGKGTTALMAKKNNRKYIGFEIAQEYIDVAERNFGKYA